LNPSGVSDRLFQLEGRKAESAQALADLPQRWHVKERLSPILVIAIPAIRPDTDPRSSA
jgi:hypothetical protein